MAKRFKTDQEFNYFSSSNMDDVAKILNAMKLNGQNRVYNVYRAVYIVQIRDQLTPD